MNEEAIIDRLVRFILGARGIQKHRKDKDLMDDGGGTSKGRDREPKDKPPRDDLKKRFRKKRKTPSECDLDTDNDPDKKIGSLLRKRRDYGESRRMARLLKAKISYWYTLGNGGILFFATKKWPAAYIHDIGDEYLIREFFSQAKVKKLFEKDSEPFRAQVYSGSPGPMDWDQFRLWLMGRSGHGALLSRIRSGILADNLIRMISKQKKMDKVELVDYLVGRHNMSLPTFQQIYGEPEFGESGRISQEKYGKWNIIYDAKASMGVDDVKKLLDEASRVVASKGFGNLAYGDVAATNTLKSGRMAEYYPGGDSIRIRFGRASANQDSLRCLLHELGHRNIRKNLGSNEIGKIKIKYREKMRGIETLDKGDVIVSKDGDVAKVIGQDFNMRSGIKWIVKVEDSSGNRLRTDGHYKLPSQLIGVEWVKKGGSGASEKQAWFPTAYSTKNAEEFYCELFADWCLGELREPAKFWMDEIN